MKPDAEKDSNYLWAMAMSVENMALRRRIAQLEDRHRDNWATIHNLIEIIEEETPNERSFWRRRNPPHPKTAQMRVLQPASRDPALGAVPVPGEVGDEQRPEGVRNPPPLPNAGPPVVLP